MNKFKNYYFIIRLYHFMLNNQKYSHKSVNSFNIQSGFFFLGTRTRYMSYTSSLGFSPPMNLMINQRVTLRRPRAGLLNLRRKKTSRRREVI